MQTAQRSGKNQSFEPGMTGSLVARRHGVTASQLFLWRKQYQEGSLTAVAAGEHVVYKLALLMPCSRHTSVTGVPVSACFRMDMIWLSLKLDFFIEISPVQITRKFSRLKT